MKALLWISIITITACAQAENVDPIYQGKPESYWLNTLTNQNPEFFMHRLQPGWSVLGTNAMPLAIKGLDKWGKNEAVLRNISIIFQGTVDPKTYTELATNDGNPLIRGLALSGLAFNGDKTITSLMVNALSDTNPEVLLPAIDGLSLTARLFIPGELPALVKCLQSPDPDVRFNAAFLLCVQPQNGNQPQIGLTYDDIAEAAFQEIKKAATNSDPYISQAATKALKVNLRIPESALTTYAHELDISRVELTGKQWTATLKTVDESNQPVSGADASIGYYMPNVDVAGEIESDWQVIKGITDSNGIFIASHKGSFPAGYSAGKTGYYPSKAAREGIGLDDNDPAKWHPTVTLVLKKIGKPIAMYAKKEETKMPKENEPIGFDLTVGDWVAPYGTGKTADMFFIVHRKVVNVHEYDAELTLTFPNKGDGIAVAPPQPGMGSDFTTSRTASESGYNPEQTWHYSNSETPLSVSGYFIRVRTVLDENGNVKSALYGKINGDVRFYVGTKVPRSGIGFEYCLNPTPNDRNLEFDPKHNLLGGLKSFEEVKAP